jgi:alpha-L-rhamnosidase
MKGAVQWMCCFVGLCLLAPVLSAGPTGLKCDYRVEPLAVDKEAVTFFWQHDSGSQKSYRIQVAASRQHLVDETDLLWDSGQVPSAVSIQVPYAGRVLEPGARYFWRVGTDSDDGESWSEISWFETALDPAEGWAEAGWISCSRPAESPELAPDGWLGEWISIDQEDGLELTYAFELPDQKVVYAGAYWSESGSDSPLEVIVNGVSCKYTLRAPARNYADFAFELKPGRNDVRIRLESGHPEKAVNFGMRIRLADGSEQWVRSSGEWRSEGGEPVTVIKHLNGTPEVVHSLKPIPATWYKRAFKPAREVTHARLYICGLGFFEAYLNGQKIGDHVLDAGQSDYEAFAYYQTFDVGNLVTEDENCLSVLVGDGWYNQDRGFCLPSLRYGKPGLIAKLILHHADGSVTTIGTDSSWRWAESKIRLSNIYLGEVVDFRLQREDWADPFSFDGWKPAMTVSPLSPMLVPQDFEPARKIREIEPVEVKQTGPESWVFDVGKNISGWVKIRFNEASGKEIRIRCTEMLDEETGGLENVPRSFWWCHGAPQNHLLVADGNPQVWEPSFNYHAFQYFEVSGTSRKPDVTAVEVFSDVRQTGFFESSDPLLNEIFRMGVDTHYMNMHSILEDCPHREKCQWGGDLHSSWATGFYAMDSAPFYRQQVRVFYTGRMDPRGIPGNIGVGKRITTSLTDFSWGVSPLFIAWRSYKMYGDLDTARHYYREMKRYLEYFEENSEDYIPVEAAHGDHAYPLVVDREPQDKRLISALNFFAAANRFSELAGALGNTADADWSEDLAGRISTSIHKRYYDPERDTFGNGTHDSLALAFDLPPSGERPRVVSSLADVYLRNGGQFDGGFMSYHIYPELSRNGYVDLAYEMLMNPDYPGIAWSIETFGATSVWERYVRPNEKGMAGLQRVSHAHHAMNHPSAWMLTDLLGIQANPLYPGFQNFILAPRIPEKLDWAKGSVETLHGKITSAWRREKGRVFWSFSVPANCTAEVTVPFAGAVTCDGKDYPRGLAGLQFPPGPHEVSWEP